MRPFERRKRDSVIFSSESFQAPPSVPLIQKKMKKYVEGSIITRRFGVRANLYPKMYASRNVLTLSDFFNNNP